MVVGDLAIPTQPDGSVWIHYARPAPERFVSAADVLSGAADVRQFEGKLVLVGVTALAIGDYRATPVADRMPDVEIHAQLIEGIFDGDLLSRPWWTVWLEAAVLAAAGGILILALPALPAAASTAIAAALAAATMALALGFYFGGRILFDAAVPIIGMGALFTAMLGTTLAEAQGQRRALRRQMARQREIAARLAGELEAARRIQMGSLPTPAAAFPGETRFDLYAFLEPAREVGGDLYDFFRLDADRIFLLVGDVSGKGLPGSLFMAMSKSLCKSIALRDRGRRRVADAAGRPGDLPGQCGEPLRHRLGGHRRRGDRRDPVRQCRPRRPVSAVPRCGRPAGSPRAAGRRSASSTSFPTRPRATGCAEGRSSVW